MFSCAFVLSVFVVLGHGANLPLKKAQASGTISKIIGGHPVDITEIPYQISLRYNGKQRCGGAIISNWFIVTAAHCIGGISASKLSVRAGITYQTEVGQEIQVASVYEHPAFRWPDYDIAVLELAQQLTYNNAVQPIQMTRAEIPSGGMALVSGWGFTEENGDISNELLATQVPLITTEECKNYYASAITDRMICAGYPDQGGFDACQGDSGGPLVYNHELVGVVSFGFGCGRPDKPGAYAKVSELRDFVYQVTGI